MAIVMQNGMQLLACLALAMRMSSTTVRLLCPTYVGMCANTSLKSQLLDYLLDVSCVVKMDVYVHRYVVVTINYINTSIDTCWSGFLLN